ncbi:class I SAM-dependent rRNA methyltransferase [Oleiharenicola lentus]|uniref:Class I SAM-dependent rRNA methyltransferase n=1 Tax=Oleiharenicola lentus TaxID=2508720 RepID=A0A4Q1CC24_9BACT|nr:class I SAM-dependent rRNA methyltransferase [Oleiharenicola lentus]RXK56462.1 class I SAM-dependent rRNA methyltransferase [Oleiharenicola lentus]
MSVSLKLKPNANARVLKGHPWVFANECEALLPAEHDGSVVECRDRTGRLLGTGICNSKSQIVWRRLSRERVTLDETFLRGALEKALARRQGLGSFRRLVWSESDDLPGLVVDQFGDTLVVQIQTLAMDRQAARLADLLAGLTGAAEIIFRNDSNLRKLEGLAPSVTTRSGKNWEPRWAEIDGFQYWLDLQGGQKTGFYLDQRLQHAAVAKYASGRRVLDAFCNQGSFALHCAKADAATVLGLDSAFDAVAQAKKNADRNGLKADFQGVNVFDWFTAQRDAAPAWDLIILDPPPFAKSKSALEGALRGYKELNLRAMKALTPGGVLATYTCSHHMQDSQLREVLADAAADAKRRVHVLEFCHQPADHPVLVTMPESEYLRGYILRVE